MTDEQRYNHDVMGLIASGEARIVPNSFAGQKIDPGSVPMNVKSVRLPMRLIDRAEAEQHPDGVSGVIRDALAAWFAAKDEPTQPLTINRGELHRLIDAAIDVAALRQAS